MGGIYVQISIFSSAKMGFLTDRLYARPPFQVRICLLQEFIRRGARNGTQRSTQSSSDIRVEFVDGIVRVVLEV